MVFDCSQKPIWTWTSGGAEQHKRGNGLILEQLLLLNRKPPTLTRWSIHLGSFYLSELRFAINRKSKWKHLRDLGALTQQRRVSEHTSTVSVTEPHYRIHLFQKGNALEGSDPLFLPVQIPAAENQEKQGQGWPSTIMCRLSISPLVWSWVRVRTQPVNSHHWGG